MAPPQKTPNATPSTTTTTTTGWDDLPPNMHHEIIKRLATTKSLLRCMSTCSSMFSTVTSPSLMIDSNHLRNRKPPPPSYHMFSYSSEGSQWLFLSRDVNDERFEAVNKIACSPVDPTYFLIGSCYGLVCFANHLHPNTNIVIWNPFLGMYLTLPMARLSGFERRYELGFGFDRSCLDYKVVRVGFPAFMDNSVFADVYSVSAVTWKRVMGSTSRTVSRVESPGVFVDDCLHWIVYTDDEEKYSILKFNIPNEEFGEIRIPNEVNANGKIVTLTKFTIGEKEKLAVYNMDRICKVWVMEVPNSWTKLCAIDVGNDYGKMFCARNNGNIIGCTTFEKKLFSYDPEARVLRNDVTIGHKSQLEYVGPLVRSLVFPGDYRRALGGKRFRLEEEEKEDEDDELSKGKEDLERRVLFQQETILLNILALQNDF